MTSRKLVAAALALTALLIGGLYYRLSTGLTLELTDAKYSNPHHMVFGSYRWEPTFENIMTKFATNVVIGTVKSTPQGDGPVGMFDLEVSEDLIGDIGENLIKIYADANALQVEQQYLLVLSKAAFAEYPFDFYVVFHSFILQIDDSEGLSRLINPVHQTFVRPFVEQKYNTLAEIRPRIRAMASRNRNKDNPDTVIEKAPNLQALVDLSDHVLHIEIRETSATCLGLVVTAGVSIVNAYKGGDLPYMADLVRGYRDVHALILPANVKVGEQYMVFLRGIEGGGGLLVTRHGSLISKEDERFDAVVAMFKDR